MEADLNARIMVPVASYVSDRFGRRALEDVCRGAGVSSSSFDGSTHWLGVEQVERFLARVRELVGSDDELKRACAYRLATLPAPARFVIGAISPAAAFELAAKTVSFVSSISSFETARDGNRFVLRYRSGRPEGRLLCLSRQAQIVVVPTMWGLPEAHLSERKCIARGDDCCEYSLYLYEHRRWLPAVLGLVAGALVAWLIARTDLVGPVGPFAIAALGLVAGHLYEAHRSSRANLRVGHEINEAFLALAQDDAEARRELIALHERQRDWARLMEEQVADRTATLESVVEKVRQVQATRVHHLRGFSHDLRNPLASFKASVSYLRKHADALGDDGEDVLAVLDRGVMHMDRLLSDLMQVAIAEPGLLDVAPEEIDVGHLTERLRRSLRALVHGSDIRSSVFTTREAPERIKTDPSLLDRVFDNLLTNAAKYTERGSIVVEVGGTPGFLTVKVSDTGHGIPDEQLDRIFRPGATTRRSRTTGSWGVGLSVCVQLLAQIGGRLDVMSKLGTGTTFWVHLPVEPRVATPRPPQSVVGTDAAADLVDRVVTVRRLKSV